MLLTEHEQAMARGEYGPGIQRCMDILAKFGEAMGAKRLVPIASGHTMPKEPPELLERLTEGVSAVGAFTTLHALMDAFSPEGADRMGQPADFLKQERADFARRREIYQRCGFMQTYTCLPTLVGNAPRKGQLCSWIGSGSQLMLNSLVGARCNRDGTIINLASAIAGRTPLTGLLLDENRPAKVLVRFSGLDPAVLTPAELGAAAYHLGAVAGNRNVAVEGLPQDMPLERLKYFMAPLPVSGSVGLCHVVGMTPEAASRDQALDGRKPEQTVTLGPDEIAASLNQYAAPAGTEVDIALFGCPHTMVTEVQYLAGLLDGRKLAPGKRLWIGMPHQQHKLAQLMGYTQPVEDAGGVFASSCMACIPNAPLPESVRVLATNSFKAAHYITRLSKGRVKVVVGDMDQCVAAITGGTWKGGAA